MFVSKAVKCRPEKCALCRSRIDYGKIIGPLYKVGDFFVHHMCLVYANSLIPHENKEYGTQVYLVDDILRELERSKNLQCVLCKKMGATSTCCANECQRKFHFPCGFRNAIHVQSRTPKIYCSQHRPMHALMKHVHSRSSSKCCLCLGKIDFIENPRDISSIGASNVDSLMLPDRDHSWLVDKTKSLFEILNEYRSGSRRPPGIFYPKKVEITTHYHAGTKLKYIASNPVTCVLCRSTLYDKFSLGERYQLDGIVVHHNCLLFAHKLQQKGQKEEGILGFLKDDILREVERAKNLECLYCFKNGATSRFEGAREENFHLPCRGYSALLLFREPHIPGLYCSNHQPIENNLTEKGSSCYICCIREEDLPYYHSLHIAYHSLHITSCCRSVFHQYCLWRRVILMNESILCCPNCNDGQKFTQGVSNDGIDIHLRITGSHPCRYNLQKTFESSSNDRELHNMDSFTSQKVDLPTKRQDDSHDQSANHYDRCTNYFSDNYSRLISKEEKGDVSIYDPSNREGLVDSNLNSTQKI